jgi:hypothetical protein
MKNVNFMKRMSAADIWNAAPSTVRESTTTPERPQPATPVWKNTSRQDIANHDRDNASIGGANSISSFPTNAQRRPSLDMTIGTTNSPLTRGTNGNTRLSNISDLETSVARQQEEFQKLSNRLDKMDKRNTRANEVYHKIGSFQIQLDQMYLALQKICESIDIGRERSKASRSNRKKKKDQHLSSSDESMNSETTDTESGTMPSPEKKKLRSKRQPEHASYNINEDASNIPVVSLLTEDDDNKAATQIDRKHAQDNSSCVSNEFLPD